MRWLNSLASLMVCALSAAYALPVARSGCRLAGEKKKKKKKKKKTRVRAPAYAGVCSLWVELLCPRTALARPMAAIRTRTGVPPPVPALSASRVNAFFDCLRHLRTFSGSELVFSAVGVRHRGGIARMATAANASLEYQSDDAPYGVAGEAESNARVFAVYRTRAKRTRTKGIARSKGKHTAQATA